MKYQLEIRRKFELEAIPPYDFELTIRKAIQIARGSLPAGKVYWSALLTPPPTIGVRVESLGTTEKPKLLCTLFSEHELSNDEEEKALAEVKCRLCLDEDLSEFYQMAQGNKILNRAVKALYGLREIGRTNLFDWLVTAILLQNAPVKRSNAMIDFITRTYGVPAMFDNRTYYAPLIPTALAHASINDLKEEGKLGYRATYIKTLANEFSPDLEKKLEKMSTEEAKKELMRLKGVGEYTAEFALLGTLYDGKRRYDVFPADRWNSQLYLKLFFPEEVLSTLSKDEILSKAKNHAKDLWGKWRGLVWVYLLKSSL
jgi:3-methyladenine DNA glycosylase/8-oxoguanine DNA glycosylase